MFVLGVICSPISLPQSNLSGVSGVYGDEAVVTCTEGWLILSGHRTQTIICERTGRWTTPETCTGVIIVYIILWLLYTFLSVIINDY